MEAAAQPHSMEVEVAAVKQEVLHGFLHVPAPGEVRVGDQTQAVVCVESGVHVCANGGRSSSSSSCDLFCFISLLGPVSLR